MIKQTRNHPQGRGVEERPDQHFRTIEALIEHYLVTPTAPTMGNDRPAPPPPPPMRRAVDLEQPLTFDAPLLWLLLGTPTLCLLFSLWSGLCQP